MESNTDNTNVTPEAQNQPAEVHTAPPQKQKQKQMMMYAAIGVALLVVVGGIWWYMSANKPKPVVKHTYKVGLMTVDGAFPADGNVVKQGAKLAERLLKTDAIDVEFVMKATDCDKEPAKKAMEEFAQENVIAVVGEFCSSATLAAAPVANASHIPLISGAATSPTVTTEGGEYVYRTIPSDSLLTKFLADTMYNKYKIRTLAIMHSDEVYGNGARDSLKKDFEALGGKVVADEAYVKDQTDFSTSLQKIKAANPDGFYYVGLFGSGQTIFIEKQKAGITALSFGDQSLKDPSFVTGAAGAAEGLVMVTSNDGNKQFKEKFQAAYGAVPTPYGAQTYDAVAAIIEALKNGATTGQTVKAQLDKMSFDGASGKIKFDANGDVAGNYALYTVKSGQIIAVE
jgi:branched-chain amino acid transport system substrate-binding protein